LTLFAHAHQQSTYQKPLFKALPDYQLICFGFRATSAVDAAPSVLVMNQVMAV
jgi:hypothetical protein